MNISEEFRAAMIQAGLPCDCPLPPDGVFRRFTPPGDKDDNGWFVLHGDGVIPAGRFGSWKRGIDEKWRLAGAKMDPKELAACQARWRQDEIQRAKDEAERHERMAEKAEAYVVSLSEASDDHFYLRTKQVKPLGGIRQNTDGELVLPLADAAGKVWSYQTIDTIGDKLFMPGGRVQGCFFTIAERNDGPLVICEGYATGASIAESTGWAVVCAMNCGNLMRVGQDLRKLMPSRPIVFGADNDRFTSVSGEVKNPGKEAAEAAAKAIKGIAVVAEFADEDLRGTDFNDLFTTSGPMEVRRQFEAGCPFKLSFMTYEAVRSLNLPKEYILLGDHVLALGGLAAFLAPGGVGKSTLIQQLVAACCAGHEKFLAWDINPCAHTVRWMIIQAENSAQRMKQEAERLKAWLSPEGWLLFTQKALVLNQLQEADSFLDLDNPEAALRIRQAIDLFAPDVVIFDALYNFSLRELSKGAEMLAAISNCTRLAKWSNPNRTPIIMHHALTGSGGAARAVGFERATYGRDSKILHQLARSVVNMTAVSEDNNDKLLVTCGKCSDGVEFGPFIIRRNEETSLFEIDSETDVNATITAIKENKRSTAIMTPVRVRELCAVSGSTRVELVSSIREDCGCTRESAYRYMRQAVSSDTIKENSERIFFKN
jgi:phage/plasmid primase-like uncharacterized protein